MSALIFSAGRFTLQDISCMHHTNKSSRFWQNGTKNEFSAISPSDASFYASNSTDCRLKTVENGTNSYKVSEENPFAAYSVWLNNTSN